MKHTYTKSKQIGNWTIKISPSTHYGYFEYYNIINGIEHQTEGGLWFSGKSLIDYDGTFELPATVIKSLVSLGYTVDQEFNPPAPSK